jgi:hypothetical protein
MTEMRIAQIAAARSRVLVAAAAKQDHAITDPPLSKFVGLSLVQKASVFKQKSATNKIRIEMNLVAECAVSCFTNWHSLFSVR